MYIGWPIFFLEIFFLVLIVDLSILVLCIPIDPGDCDIHEALKYCLANENLLE